MRARVLDLAARSGGVVTRAEALQVASRAAFDGAVRAGDLVRVLPGTYAMVGIDLDPAIRRRAALRYVRTGALSHTTALDVHGLRPGGDPGGTAVHVTVAAPRPATAQPGLVVHRRRGFSPEPPLAVSRDGFAVVRLEQAVVESWPLLPEIDRRAPAIVAVRERRTTPDRLLATLQLLGRAGGAAMQRELFGKLRDGCHSELELWGHDRVFTHPSMPPSQGQVPVRVGGRAYYLDRLFAAERVVAELDGAAHHESPGQRERDARRDAALARLGYLTVRFSHHRLHADADGVRVELLDILRVRRRQLRGC